MNNFQFLRDYQELQHTIMFDKLIDLPFGRVGFCEEDKSAFWNQVLVNQPLTQSQLALIEATFKKLDRPPAVYFENRKLLTPLKEFLLKNQFKHSFEDCWLFHPGEKIKTERFNQVRKVLTDRELEIFLKTFNACFQKDDPQNPSISLFSN